MNKYLDYEGLKHYNDKIQSQFDEALYVLNSGNIAYNDLDTVNAIGVNLN